MALSKSAILRHAGSSDRREVHVPAWKDDTGDDVVIVRGMVLREFEILGKTAAQAGDDASARLLARVILDADGRRLFEDSDASQINELPLSDVTELMKAVNELSGLGDTDEKQAAIDKAIVGESEAQTSSS